MVAGGVDGCGAIQKRDRGGCNGVPSAVGEPHLVTQLQNNKNGFECETHCFEQGQFWKVWLEEVT